MSEKETEAVQTVQYVVQQVVLKNADTANYGCNADNANTGKF